MASLLIHLIKLVYTYKAKTKKKTMIRMFGYYFHDLSRGIYHPGCVLFSLSSTWSNGLVNTLWKIVIFFGSEFSGHPCSVALRERRNIRMLCFEKKGFRKNQRCRSFTAERVTVVVRELYFLKASQKTMTADLKQNYDAETSNSVVGKIENMIVEGELRRGGKQH